MGINQGVRNATWGLSEQAAVLDLAVLYWRRLLIARLWTLEILRSPFCQEIVEASGDSWGEVAANVRAAGEKQGSKQREAQKACAKILAQLSLCIEKMQATADVDELDKLLANVDSLKNIAAHVAEVAKALNAEEAFNAFNNPERFEKLLKLEASLDARIAKVTGRLVAIKEFKRTPAGSGSGQLAPPSSPP